MSVGSSRSITTSDSLSIDLRFTSDDIVVSMAPSLTAAGKSAKYPAKEHFVRVLEYIKSKSSSTGQGVIYLEGQKTRMNEDNDQEAPFRQRRYFYYLTGCELPDCYVTYDQKTHKSILYIPPVNDDDVVWSGLPLSTEEALER